MVRQIFGGVSQRRLVIVFAPGRTWVGVEANTGASGYFIHRGLRGYGISRILRAYAGAMSAFCRLPRFASTCWFGCVCHDRSNANGP